jgi:hypothetical protein
VFGVGPLSEGSLNESLGLSISSRGIRPGAVMFELHVLASLSELSGPVAGAVVSEQGANSDAESSKEFHGRVQELDGGLGFLIGQHLRECDAGVVIDGHMESQEARMLLLAAQAAIAAQAHFGKSGFDSSKEI